MHFSGALKGNTNSGIDWNFNRDWLQPSRSPQRFSDLFLRITHQQRFQHLKTVSEENDNVTRLRVGVKRHRDRKQSAGEPQMENVIVVVVAGGAESGRCQKSEWKISAILHQGIGGNRPWSAGLPEYGGLGGTGGHSNLPTESEKDGAPSLTLSRLQLLGVGLTYSTQKHHKSLDRLWTQDNMEHSGFHISHGWCDDWELNQNVHFTQNSKMHSSLTQLRKLSLDGFHLERV